MSVYAISVSHVRGSYQYMPHGELRSALTHPRGFKEFLFLFQGSLALIIFDALRGIKEIRLGVISVYAAWHCDQLSRTARDLNNCVRGAYQCMQHGNVICFDTPLGVPVPISGWFTCVAIAVGYAAWHCDQLSRTPSQGDLKRSSSYFRVV